VNNISVLAEDCRSQTNRADKNAQDFLIAAFLAALAPDLEMPKPYAMGEIRAKQLPDMGGHAADRVQRRPQ
jgi:hypothetical protein